MTISSTDLAALFESRASVRQYVQEAVPQHDLQEILRLAGLALSAWNLQPWRFVVITNKALKDQMHSEAAKQPQVQSAPVLIVVVADGERMLQELDGVVRDEVRHDPAKLEGFKTMLAGAFGERTPKEKSQWAAAQSYLAVGYLTLAAHGLGYDTSVMLGFNPQEVKRILNLPAHAEIPALIALGKAAAPGAPKHRHALADIATFVG